MAITKGNNLNLGRDDAGAALRVSYKQRETHLYVCGGTGMGKSRLLESLIRQDIEQWRNSHCGMLLLDPHGALYDGITQWLASPTQVLSETHKRPIVTIDLRTDGFAVGYNVLRSRSGDPTSMIAELSEAIAYGSGQDSTQETPRFANIVNATLHALYVAGMGLTEIFDVLHHGNKNLREQLIPQMPRAAAAEFIYLNALNATEYNTKIESTLNRISPLLRNPQLSRMFGQTERSFDFDRAIADGQIVLVSLATAGGLVSSANAKMLATVMLADLWAAVERRGKGRTMPKPFYTYIDEFQRFITPTISENLDEARGFGLHMTLANQFPSQLRLAGERGERLLHSVMNNIHTKVFMGQENRPETQAMAEWLFMGTIDTEQVKYDLKTRGVVNEFETTRTIVTESTSDTDGYTEGETEGDSLTQNAGNSDSVSHAQVMHTNPKQGLGVEREAPQYTETTVAGVSGATGAGQSRGTSYSTSSSRTVGTSTQEVPFIEREFGEQLSSRQFRSVEEQLFQAQQRIFNLKPREAWVRVAGSKTPLKMRTHDIADAPYNQAQQERLRMSLIKRWKFIKSKEDAQTEIDERQAATGITASALINAQEPTEFRNRRRTLSASDAA